jgi:Replication-relaxation
VSAPARVIDRPLPAVAPAVLAGLYQHRLLTTRQVHALYTPTAGDRWTRKVLEVLKDRELVDRVRGPGTLSCWYLTDAGAEAVEAAGPRSEQRRRVPTRAQAEGLLKRHTLAVNQVGIAFVAAAHQRGDECGPDSWRHEIAHPISPGSVRRPAQLVVADAMLTYLQTGDDGSLVMHQRFVEVDRGTARPADQLAAKLARYTRLRTYTPSTEEQAEPLWRSYYRAWPHVLIVLANQSHARVTQRIARVLALYESDPAKGLRRAIPFSFVSLTDLTAHGPFAPIFTNPTSAEPVDWLGNESQPPTRQEGKNAEPITNMASDTRRLLLGGSEARRR